MDSADDDFGELYIDAKAPATASSAGEVGSVKSSKESEPASVCDKKKLEDCALNRTKANDESEYSDSESEDDLDIVLKDDDSKSLPVASSSFTNSGGYDSAYSVGMFQCGEYSFSYPWFRTSFDVNLDAFEKKPWRNPGVDVSDFFNFGLNEQSWKEYCKPLGRAIEVECGTLERKPSADSRCPRDSDPDVVIQVPVTDDVEELPSLTPLESKSLSLSSNEASGSEDSRLNNSTDLKPFGDSIKDEAFVGCLDENDDSLSHEQSTPTENCCSREVAVCEKEMIEEKKEETFWKSDGADTSSTESESSREDRIRISPTSSCSVGKTEESEDYETESSKDSDTDDHREVSTPPRQARPTEHEVVSIRSGERSDRKHSRHRTTHEDSRERHSGKAGYAVHKHRIVKDESHSHTPDADLGKKFRSRRGGSYRDSIKNWQNGPHFTLERDGTEGRGFRHSNREKCHDRLYPSVDHARHREHRFGWDNDKDSLRGRGFDHSVYKYEAHFQEYTSRSSFNVNQRNYRSSLKEEDDRYGRQWHHCEEKYGHERRSALACERDKERDRYERLRESYYQDRIPLNDVDNRYQLEYSSAHRNPRQSHEDSLHSRRSDDEYNFHRRRYEDRVHRAEIGVPIELAYREMHSFAAVRRREFQRYERNGDFPELDKRHDYAHDWHRLDRFVSEKDGYRTEDVWPTPLLPLRDHCYPREPRGDSLRYGTRDFAAEAYDSQNDRFYKAAPRDGWMQSRVHSDYVSIQDRLTYEDEWVRRDRGRYSLADEIHFSTREVAHSEHPSYTDELLVRDIRMPIHNRLSTKQRYHRSKKLRGDRHNAFIECQDPVDLTGRQVKLSNQSKRRFSIVGDATEQADGQKPRKLICRSDENSVQIGDLNDKEEGEIVEETRNAKGGVEMNNERIQESLKKMEKRRERFKLTSSVMTVEATFKSQTEPSSKTDDFTNQQRRIRKRRWCGA